MGAAEKIEAAISDRLTWDEIRERYPDQYVCTVEVDLGEPEGFEIQTARVVGWGASYQEAFARARPWRAFYEELQIDFTGTSDRICPPHPDLSCATSRGPEAGS